MCNLTKVFGQYKLYVLARGFKSIRQDFKELVIRSIHVNLYLLSKISKKWHSSVGQLFSCEDAAQQVLMYVCLSFCPSVTKLKFFLTKVSNG